MRLRTTMFLWVLALVTVVVGAAIGAVAVVFERSTRARVGDELARGREVVLDLHASRQALLRQECRVVADEPRLLAVVNSEDVGRDTIVDAVRTLARSIDAGVFVLVDADGRLVADSADPEATGFDLTDRPVVRRTLERGEEGGVWLADGKVFQVQGCRQTYGARVVGALVLGHPIDDATAGVMARHTGDDVVVISDDHAVTRLPAGVEAAELPAALAAARRGQAEVTLGGAAWYAQIVAIPGYLGARGIDYLVLRSIDEALAPARRIVRLLLALVAVAALATLVLAFGLARRLSRPIDALVARTRAIAAGDLAPRPAPGPAEVQALGVAMDRMARELDAGRTALADRERLARELEIAARIQTSILPRALAVEGLELAARMQPATEVGGDYYDVLPTEGGGWLAIGDASGHGLTSGLVMMMVQAGVAALVRARPDGSPREVLATLNRVVYENVHARLDAERHMTLSLMRYRADGELVVAGAHMDAVAWRAATGACELLPTPGTFLGLAEDIDHVNVEATWRLAPGDVLVALTDGVTEAESAAGEPFGYDRACAAVAAHARAPVEAIRDALFDALASHCPRPPDDATLLILRYVGARVTPGS